MKCWAAQAEINREQQLLGRCRSLEACPTVAQSLVDIVAEGASRSGLARIGLINRALNLAITATSDEAQWGWRTIGAYLSRLCEPVAVIARTTRS